MDAGLILHYQGPEDFLAVVLYHDGSGLVFACLYEFKDGAAGNLLDWDGGFALTDTTTYTLKCVVDDDPNNSALQRLRFYVGGTLRLTSFKVDDSWPGGRVGLVRLTSPTATALQWDNFKVGQDNGGNGSIDDGGDYVFASYDFGASHLTLNLGYDNNGNLTDDGSLRYRYDGWNRLVRACYSAQDPNDPNQCFARYSFLADGRRSEKVVTLRGAEAVANDGGNQTVRFLYGSQSPDREGAGQPPWSIFETRNGSNQSTWQYVWGTQYIDEIVFADKNGDPTVSNDCNPDVAATGESGETPADHRYFYHQDRNWNVVAVTDYDSDPNAAANGAIVERFLATATVPFVLTGTSAGLELGTTRATSTKGAAVAVADTTDTIPFRGGSGTTNQAMQIVPHVPPPPKPKGPRPAPPGQVRLELRCCEVAGSPWKHCELYVVQSDGTECQFGGTGPGGIADEPGDSCVGPGIRSPGCRSPGQPKPPGYGETCYTATPDPAGTANAPQSVLDCLKRANRHFCASGGYNAFGSNSNAVLAQMLACCGVSCGSVRMPESAPGRTGCYGSPGALGNGQGTSPCVHMVDNLGHLLCPRCATCTEMGF